MSDLELGRENNTDEGTQLDCSDGYEAAVGLFVLMTDETPGQRTAITGDSQTAAGGIGISGAGAATGVLGLGGTTGVSGQGGQDGVLGTTTVTNGVRGLALGFGIGVLGENVSNAPNGAGVKGTSRMGDAVWGIGHTGVHGESSAPERYGVWGEHTQNGYGDCCTIR